MPSIVVSLCCARTNGDNQPESEPDGILGECPGWQWAWVLPDAQRRSQLGGYQKHTEENTMKLPILSRLFSSFLSRGKKDSPDDSGKANGDAEELGSGGDHEKLIRQAIEQTYSNLGVFVRDVNLPENLAAKYIAGLIFQDPGIIDASQRIGGMATTHRFAILSNHMKSLEVFDLENRGLCVAMSGSRFKVLGTHQHNGKTFILLLHLPDGDEWKAFRYIRVDIDDTIKNECVQRLEEKCGEPVIPELAGEEWLERCEDPIGLDDSGEFFHLCK
jgi:hypothetical protein